MTEEQAMTAPTGDPTPNVVMSSPDSGYQNYYLPVGFTADQLLYAVNHIEQAEAELAEALALLHGLVDAKDNYEEIWSLADARAFLAAVPLTFAHVAGLREAHPYSAFCSPKDGEFDDPDCYCDKSNYPVLGDMSRQGQP